MNLYYLDGEIATLTLTASGGEEGKITCLEHSLFKQLLYRALATLVTPKLAVASLIE